MLTMKLTAQQRIFLAHCISVGLGGSDADEDMENAIEMIIGELVAQEGAVRLVVADEHSITINPTPPDILSALED